MDEMHDSSRNDGTSSSSKLGNKGNMSKKYKREKTQQEMDEEEEFLDNVLSQVQAATVCAIGIPLDFGDEEEYDTDLEDEKFPKITPVPQDDKDRVVYLKACKKFKITPSSTFLRGIKGQIVQLNHQRLGPDGAKAVAISLVYNHTVSELYMRRNLIGRNGIKYVADMLRENEMISKLDLSENNLQSYGAEVLCNTLLDTDNLLSLRISGNGFKTPEAENFSRMISDYRCSLRELDISHNDFGEIGGKLLGEAISNNESIETLNLSWNNLGFVGAKAIAKGLEENNTIKHLDLSWNGMCDKGAKLVSEATTINDTIETLNLESNRIGPTGLAQVVTAITGNKNIRALDVSNNPISFEGPVIAIKLLQQHTECGLELLEFRDMCVSYEFTPILADIQSLKPKFKVNHGGFVNGSDSIIHSIKQRGENILNDPIMKLFEYVEERNLRWTDLFRKLDTDQSMTISEEEFTNGIRREGIPLTDEQINTLIERLDTDKNGEVDFGELLDGQKKYLRRLERIASEVPVDHPLLKSRPTTRVGRKTPRPSSTTQTTSSRPSSAVSVKNEESGTQSSVEVNGNDQNVEVSLVDPS